MIETMTAAASAAGVEMWLTMGALLVTGFVIGTVAIVAGVGGGVLFVPLATALFSLHVDFIRGAGLMVALIGAAAAAPPLMRQRLSRLRIAIPLALAGSTGSIVGARLGFIVPEKSILVALGILMLAIALQTGVAAFRAKKKRSPNSPDDQAGSGKHQDTTVKPRGLSARIVTAWHLHGSYRDPANGEIIHWRACCIAPAMALFVGIGIIGGALGVGAGWANVPVLVSLVGLPLKLAAATSGLIIIANSSTAAWVYLRSGAMDPLIIVPAVVGMVAGTRIGVHLLGRARPEMIRLLVIAMLLAAGTRTLWGVLQ